MKKTLLMALFLLSFHGCIVHDHPPSTVDHSQEEGNFYDYHDVVIMDYYLWCEDTTPYSRLPEFCDEDPYGEWLCCTWDLGLECYEEWCVWYDNCEWLYDDFICY